MNPTKILLCLAATGLMLLALTSAQELTEAEKKTNALIAEMYDFYGTSQIEQYFPFIKYANCSSCTTGDGSATRVWVIGTSDTYLRVQNYQTSTTLYEYKGVNFCWYGVFIGMVPNYDKYVGVYSQAKNGTESISTNVEASFGRNDFTWQQCVVRGSVALGLAIGIPVAVVAVLLVLCIFCVCCCICARIEKQGKVKRMSAAERRKARQANRA